MTRQQFSLRTNLMLVAIAASFAAFVRSMFADSWSILDWVPLVVAAAWVTVFFLVRAVKRNRTSALRLIGTGAVAAFSTTSVFGVAAAIVWSAFVYADDSKGFLISPWIMVFFFVAICGSTAAVIGAMIGGVFCLGANLSGRQTQSDSQLANGNDG